MGLGSGRRWQWLERNLYLGMLRQCQRGEWAQNTVFIYRNDGLVHISLLYEGVYHCTSTRRHVSVNQTSLHLRKEEGIALCSHGGILPCSIWAQRAQAALAMPLPLRTPGAPGHGSPGA